MPSRVWARGPDMIAANGVIYGPYDGLGYAVTDDDGSVYFMPNQFGVASFIRLDPPYTTWFQMWGDPWQGMTEFGVLFTQAGKVVLVPQAGAGGARYDKDTPDLGDALNDFATSGPWETNAGTYGTTSGIWSTWQSILAGYNELNIRYCAHAQDANGWEYIIGRRSDGGDGSYYAPWDTLASAGNFSGYLDPDGEHWIRIADYPLIAGSPNIEGHSACCDSQGRVYVAGGLSAGPTDVFRRYTPGPAVGAGVVDIQRIRFTGDTPDPNDRYEAAVPRTAFTDGSVYDAVAPLVRSSHNQATIQAAYDSYLGAGVVTIAGNGLDYTVTWIAPGVQPILTLATGDLFTQPAGRVEFSSVQRGTGGPSVDTWETLDPLPVPLYAGVMLGVGTDVHYIGGHDGIDPVGTHYRYRGGAWQQLNDLPDGLTTVSTVATAGESQPGFVVGDRLVVLAYSTDSLLTAIVSFDLSNDRWGAPVYTEVNHQRGGFTLTDTHAIVMGGTDDGGDPTSAVERIRVADLAAFGGLHLAALSWRSEA